MSIVLSPDVDPVAFPSAPSEPMRPQRAWRRLAAALQAWWKRRARAAQDLKDLQAMSSRELVDLGLGSGQIDRLVGRGARERFDW